MPQNAIATTDAINPSGQQSASHLDAYGNLLTAQGTASMLDISAQTVVKNAPGRLVKISVLVAGAAGTANDCATAGAVATANEICVIPAAVGIYSLDWPCTAGIVISPGAAQVVSVVYE
jgi:hypothetical protein